MTSLLVNLPILDILSSVLGESAGTLSPSQAQWLKIIVFFLVFLSFLIWVDLLLKNTKAKGVGLGRVVREMR
jgi:hypothetical protein